VSINLPAVASRNARRVLIAASLTSLSTVAFSVAANAEDVAENPTALPPVVVTATMTPTPADQLGSSVSVITADDIARNQWRSLPDALRMLPGLNVVQAGGQGGTASLYMRGTNSNHTKVFVDGVDISNPSSLDGAIDFSQILIGDIERIEVLRGPQSGLYGSDAIGGVVSITTKKGRGPARVTAQLEGGSFETFNQAVGVSGGTERYNYGLNFGHTHSGDTPSTPSNLLAPGERVIGDGADNKTYSANLGVELTDNIGVDLTARYIDSVLKYTGDDFTAFPTIFPNSTQSKQEEKQLFTRGAVRVNMFDGRLKNEFGVGYSQAHTDFQDPTQGPSSFDGDRTKFDWRGHIAVAPGNTLVLGLEDETENLNDSPIDADLENRAAYATYQWDFDERLSVTASGRRDDNERFGGANTWRLAPSYIVPGTETHLKGSYGTGYKAPTLTQLFTDFPSFFFFANPDLQPEKSRGYDVGFEQPVFNKAVTFGTTYFHNDIDDLIQSDGTTYVNVASASTSGFETFVTWAVDERLSLRADHTFTIARDDSTGGELLRRPKHKASLTASWDATDKLNLSGGVMYVGSANDFNRYATVRNLYSDSYTVVNFAANYMLTENVSLFGRVENAFDRDYESPIGFERPGFGAFAGLKVDFQVE
jgi:vitamin B12 transporter